MCRQFDSGPRHRASFLANSQNTIRARRHRTPSNHCATQLQKAIGLVGGRSSPSRSLESSDRPEPQALVEIRDTPVGSSLGYTVRSKAARADLASVMGGRL